MFEINVEAEFCAAHALLIQGVREPVHGHNWRVTATLAGSRLDDDLLLIDFHAVEAELAAILAPFRNADLNRTPPFDGINPSAEAVARHIGDTLNRRLPDGPDRPRVVAIRVTEAPGCSVVYRPQLTTPKGR
jgi:6-pyruvoyltetrahydropterin/6-carboxytetrahydropterin synthase